MKVVEIISIQVSNTCLLLLESENTGSMSSRGARDVTCLIGGRAGRERQASQGGVVRAPAHAVDGVLVTFTEPLLTPVTSVSTRQNRGSVQDRPAAGLTPHFVSYSGTFAFSWLAAE